MKYQVTFSCGHTDTVELFGPTKDRKSRIAYLERQGRCPECEAAHARCEREKTDARDTEMELLTLEGSDKQVIWASKIRLGFIEYMAKVAERYEDSPSDMQVVYAARDNVLLTWKSARKWIDHNDFFTIAKESIMAVLSKIPSEAVSEEKAAEPVITPEQQTHNGVVRIVIENDIIRAYYPRDNNFRTVITALHYYWDSEARAWSRKITKFEGSVADRVAELGNRLLLAGFAVAISDPEMRRRAVAAEYELECRRWVALYTRGNNIGNLGIRWDREDDLFARIHTIHGARWDSGAMVVPIESWDEVLDMAELLGFRVSEGAMTAIEEYRGHLSPDVKPAEPPVVKSPDKLGEILSSQSEVIDDLADDEG